MMVRRYILTTLALTLALENSALAQTAAPQPAPVAPRQPAIAPTPSVPSTRLAPFAAIPDATFSNSRRYIDTYQQVQSYGRCVAHVGRRYAAKILDAMPNTVDERQAFRRISGISRACLSYGYAAPVVFLRGGIAEAMYKLTPAAQALHLNGVSAVDFAAFQASEASRSGARLVDDRMFANAADCLVVRGPVATRDLLMSKHGSTDELAALNSMLASAPSCTNARRFPTSGGRPFIRAYVAESAYRWAQFNQTQIAAGKTRPAKVLLASR